MLAPGEARTHNPGITLCTVYKYRALTDCATGAALQINICKPPTTLSKDWKLHINNNLSIIISVKIKSLPTARLELAIFGLGDRRLIH